MKNNKKDRKEHKFMELDRKMRYSKHYNDDVWNEISKLPFKEFMKFIHTSMGFVPWYHGGKDKDNKNDEYNRHSRKKNRNIKRTEE